MADAHDLYGLPLEQFVPARNRRAKELRTQGRQEDAQQVAGARKPSVAAWGVNQLIRTQRRAVEELFRAGDELQRAQSQLLGGAGSAETLRDTVAGEREAVDKLVEKARGLLSSEGQELTEAMLERVAETLHAAALDDQARELVSAGCLHRELKHVGLGPAASASAAPSRGDATKPSRHQKRKTDPRTLRQAEAKAGRHAERAARELEAAQARREDAAQALRDAEDALAAARARAREAAAAHRKASRSAKGT